MQGDLPEVRRRSPLDPSQDSSATAKGALVRRWRKTGRLLCAILIPSVVVVALQVLPTSFVPRLERQPTLASAVALFIGAATTLGTPFSQRVGLGPKRSIPLLWLTLFVWAAPGTDAQASSPQPPLPHLVELRPRLFCRRAVPLADIPADRPIRRLLLALGWLCS